MKVGAVVVAVCVSCIASIVSGMTQRNYYAPRRNSYHYKPGISSIDRVGGVHGLVTLGLPPRTLKITYNPYRRLRQNQYQRLYQKQYNNPYQNQYQNPYQKLNPNQKQNQNPYQKQNQNPYQKQNQNPYQKQNQNPYQKQNQNPYQKQNQNPYQKQDQKPYQTPEPHRYYLPMSQLHKPVYYPNPYRRGQTTNKNLYNNVIIPSQPKRKYRQNRRHYKYAHLDQLLASKAKRDQRVFNPKTYLNSANQYPGVSYNPRSRNRQYNQYPPKSYQQNPNKYTGQPPVYQVKDTTPYDDQPRVHETRVDTHYPNPPLKDTLYPGHHYPPPTGTGINPYATSRADKSKIPLPVGGSCYYNSLQKLKSLALGFDEHQYPGEQVRKELASRQGLIDQVEDSGSQTPFFPDTHGTCVAEAKPLWRFKRHGGSCFVVQPNTGEEITVYVCKFRDFPYKGTDKGIHKCSEKFEVRDIWAYCEDLLTPNKIIKIKKKLPIGCLPRTYSC